MGMDGDTLIWTNERRRLVDLIPWRRNPRKIRPPQVQRLVESVQEFGQVETLAIGPDNDIYNGHQRLVVLMERYGPDYEVDVRVSSRPLSEKEREKLTVYLHKGAAGEWDFEMLATEFAMPDLLAWGFEPGELELGFGMEEEEEEEPEDESTEQPDAPEDFKEYGDDIETEFCCPKCGYEWSGKPG